MAGNQLLRRNRKLLKWDQNPFVEMLQTQLQLLSGKDSI